MPTHQPDSAANRLIDRVNLLLEARERNSFALSSVKNEAQALLRADAFHAYVVLGMVACLEKNLDLSREFHAKALKLSDNYLANINFATSLDILGATTEALKYYERATRIEPENIGALEKFIDSAIAACRFRYAAELLERWRRLNPGRIHKGSKSLTACVSILEKNQVSDEEASSLQKLAMNIANRNQKYSQYVAFEITDLEDDGVKWIDYAVLMDREVDGIVEVNCEFAEAAVGEMSQKLLDSIVVRFAPVAK